MVSNYIRQHHLGLIAIFIAVTGTAYASDQLAPKHQSQRASAAKAKTGSAARRGRRGRRAAGSHRAHGTRDWAGGRRAPQAAIRSRYCRGRSGTPPDRRHRARHQPAAGLIHRRGRRQPARLHAHGRRGTHLGEGHRQRGDRMGRGHRRRRVSTRPPEIRSSPCSPFPPTMPQAAKVRVRLSEDANTGRC